MKSFFKRLFSGTRPVESDRDYFQRTIQERKTELQQRRSAALGGEKCGNVIAYQQESDGPDACFGLFYFKRLDVASILEKKLQLIPNLQGDDEGSIYQWVMNFDELKFDPVRIPSIWGRFIYVADDLVRAGESDVVCTECKRKYSTGILIPKDDKGLPSWNFDRLKCPNGHLLLKVKMLHINRR